MLEEATQTKAIEFAIATEKLGAQIYKKLAQRFEENADLHELFASLAKDETAHEREFRALLDRLPRGNEPILYEQEQYLRAMAVSEIFSDDKGLLGDAGEVATREQALEHALSLEKNTLMYFTALADVVGASEAIEAIIAAEKRHVIRVMRMMVTGESKKPL